MNIVHICLTGPVTDGWNYQDNIITKYHARLGHKVTVITSQWCWNDHGHLEKTNQNDYFNDDGVHIIRIPIKKDRFFTYRFKRYLGLKEQLDKIQMDIMFIHDTQMLDTKTIVNYLKEHDNIKVYSDCHADFSNSATNWISKNILHKIVWKHYTQMLVPYVSKFYGTLPARVDFLKNVYGIPKDKCELLVMGADDDLVKAALDPKVRVNMRKKYNIKTNDFLIMTGGKIDAWKKETILLMRAISELKEKNIKLIVFGSVSDELKDSVNSLTNKNNIQYIGWVHSQESYKLFSAADLLVFPGRHSVFWEQAVGEGKPLLVKEWEGTKHVDLGGNVRFLQKDTIEEIKEEILYIYNNKEEFINMKKISEERGMKTFSYLEIARKSIEE